LAIIDEIVPLMIEKKTTPNTIINMHTNYSVEFVPDISPYPTVDIVVIEK
jgi:hypothetical protein